MTEQRRLAAILVADVVGYSKLMGSDEAGTLAQLDALRTEIIEPQIAKHAGRLFKSVGDGFFIEFASAVQAVSCAKAIQEANDLGRLPLRIGIHVGDVVVQGDDLMGDGVNVAARIEGIADPGGIAITRAVHEQVRDKLDLGFMDKGKIELKNIQRPVQVFVIAGAKVGGQATALPLPDKPSIAVLPFQNMSGDPEQEYFADGVVEDIITALSRAKSLFVIARNSSFSYKGKSPDIRQVGRELGVRYVLEGSVRKAGNRVRISGQLIDATSGSHVWADRFESDLGDIFELQDHVTTSVVGAIAPSLELAEINRARQKIGSLVAYDYYLRSLAAFYRFTRTDHEAALSLLQKAIELDPEFALAHAIKGHWHHGVRKSSGWDENQAQEKVEAERLAQRAMELDRSDPRVLANVGVTLWWGLGRYEEGAAFIDQALEIDPNYALAWSFGGGVRLVLGRFDEAIKYCERALRLSPLDPRAFIPANVMAQAYFLSGRYDEAVSWAAKALRQHRGYPPALQTIVASHAMAGRVDAAKEACALYLRLHPTARISTIRDRLMFARNEDMEKYAIGFRLAGMRE
jgi:adenylate cyclase